MKKLIFAVALMLTALYTQAQNVCGSWSGVLQLEDKEISILFNVKKVNDVYLTTMHCPSQDVKGFRTSSTTLADSVLTINMDGSKMQFQGRLYQNNTLNGVFTQMGKRYAMNLVNQNKTAKLEAEKNLLKRSFSVYSYFTDTILINENDATNSKAVIYKPIKNKKSASVVLVCDLDKNNASKHAKEFSELSDYLCSSGFVVVCLGTTATETTIEMAKNYLKTCSEVMANKVSVVKYNASCMKGTFCSQKKSKQLYKEISKSTTEKYEAFYQLANWLSKVA